MTTWTVSGQVVGEAGPGCGFSGLDLSAPRNVGVTWTVNCGRRAHQRLKLE